MQFTPAPTPPLVDPLLPPELVPPAVDVPAAPAGPAPALPLVPTGPDPPGTSVAVTGSIEEPQPAKTVTAQTSFQLFMELTFSG
ncbi:MAG TPA: hypothetical protein VGK73_16760 [Polyangiaceae bacterium]